MMAMQGAFFGIPPVDVAEQKEPLSTGRKRTQNQRALIRKGVHPATGQGLANNEQTCGSCAHLVVLGHSDNYFKCGKMPITNGPSTDIRKSWPACKLWLSIYEPRAEA